jgi:hypothetical protein
MLKYGDTHNAELYVCLFSPDKLRRAFLGDRSESGCKASHVAGIGSVSACVCMYVCGCDLDRVSALLTRTKIHPVN